MDRSQQVAVRAVDHRRVVLSRYALGITAWSVVLLLVSGLGTRGTGYADGVEVYSSRQVLWGLFIPALLTLLAAVGALFAVRRGDARTSRLLFVVTLITGIVGLLGALLSIGALLAMRTKSQIASSGP